MFQSRVYICITPVSSLTNLTNLNLMFNKVSDLSPIYTLTNLKALFISGNPVEKNIPRDKLPAECSVDV